MRWSPASTLALCAALAAAQPPRAAAQQAPPAESLALRLAALSAVTGFEDAMADSLLAWLPGSARDRAGNVVLRRGSGAPVRIASCPMDEVGYVVGGITAEGYLTLRRVGNAPVGPLFDQELEGHRVTVFGRRGAIEGVVGVRSTHLMRGRPTGEDAPFALDHAYVDVGAATADEIRALGIELLAPVTRAKLPHRYGEGLVAAPWAAQRAACAALVAAARRGGGGDAAGTTVVAFAARRYFAHDGTAFLLAEHPGAELLLLGEGAVAVPGTGPVVGPDTVVIAGTRRVVQAAALPLRYGRTTVETVSLADVAALEQRIAAWLGGAR